MDERRISDLGVTEYFEMHRNVVRSELRQLGEDLTGLDIDRVEDRTRLRADVDYAHRSRIDAETRRATWLMALRSEAAKLAITSGLAGGILIVLRKLGLMS